MIIKRVKNPKWVDEERTMIDVEVDFFHLPEQWVSFTASKNDVTQHGKEIFNACISGKYGPIKEK